MERNRVYNGPNGLVAHPTAGGELNLELGEKIEKNLIAGVVFAQILVFGATGVNSLSNVQKFVVAINSGNDIV